MDASPSSNDDSTINVPSLTEVLIINTIPPPPFTYQYPLPYIYESPYGAPLYMDCTVVLLLYFLLRLVLVLHFSLL